MILSKIAALTTLRLMSSVISVFGRKPAKRKYAAPIRASTE